MKNAYGYAQTPRLDGEENQLFENAIAEIDPISRALFESILAKVPWKTIEEVKAQYEALVHDMEMIVLGNFPVSDCPTMESVRDPDTTNMKGKEKKEKTGKTNMPKTTDTKKSRRRGIPWTEDEHQWFLMGLNKFGKGDWRSISRYYVISKSPNQVASHAQKYYRHQNSSIPANRRRPSIHDVDINVVNPASAASSSANFISTFPPLPTFRHRYGMGAQVLEHSPPSKPKNAYNNNNNSFILPSIKSVI